MWLYAPWSGKVKDVARQGSCGSHMISISEELRAGKAAKAAVNVYLKQHYRKFEQHSPKRNMMQS
jgi:hypothetical protein